MAYFTRIFAIIIESENYLCYTDFTVILHHRYGRKVERRNAAGGNYDKQ